MAGHAPRPQTCQPMLRKKRCARFRDSLRRQPEPLQPQSQGDERSPPGAAKDSPPCSTSLARDCGLSPYSNPKLYAPPQLHYECLFGCPAALRRAAFHSRRALPCCSRNPGAPACLRCRASPFGQSPVAPHQNRRLVSHRQPLWAQAAQEHS